MIYPHAKKQLLQHLKSPKSYQPTDDKLLHNNRVYSHFLSNKTFNKDGLYGKKLQMNYNIDKIQPRTTKNSIKNMTLNPDASFLDRSIDASMINLPGSTSAITMQNFSTDPSKTDGYKTVRIPNQSSATLDPDTTLTNENASPIGDRLLEQNQDSKTMQELKNILQQCKDYKGNSTGELSEVVENLRIDLGVQVMKQKFKAAKTIQTAETIHKMKKNFPNILQTIYDEDRNRLKEQAEDELAVLKAFEYRKNDTKYYQMLERKK